MISGNDVDRGSSPTAAGTGGTFRRRLPEVNLPQPGQFFHLPVTSGPEARTNWFQNRVCRYFCSTAPKRGVQSSRIVYRWEFSDAVVPFYFTKNWIGAAI